MKRPQPQLTQVPGEGMASTKALRQEAVPWHCEESQKLNTTDRGDRRRELHETTFTGKVGQSYQTSHKP